jgi:outer membrane scaffolding protein for murein synthesis (MipA/OmpV family)
VRKHAPALVLVAALLLFAAAPAALARPAASASRATVRVSNVRIVEGDSGTAKAVLVVTTSRGSRASVRFHTADGSAEAGSDYVTASGTLRFTERKPSRRVVVKVMGDGLDELNETFTLELSDATGASISDESGRVTITDDDEGGPAFTVGDATTGEGETAAFTVSLSAPLSAAATVEYDTVDGTATAPSDYTAQSGTLTFEPGHTVKQVLVPIASDSQSEVDESYGLNLSAPSGAAVYDGVAVGTINDDDTPTISVANATITEGNSGTSNAVFTVTLSAASSAPVTFGFATTDGSATAPADYQAATGSVTMDPGQTVEQLLVPVVGDTVMESTEAFSLNLSNPTNATIADGAAQATITDNDTVSITVANATVTEGNSGTVSAVFGVTLSAQSAQVVTFDYATADGSATAPSDYLATSGSLSFDPGQTVKQIVVSVVGDTTIEIAESFTLNLTNAVNATFADATAQGSITDNDTVTISIGAATVTEVNSGTRDAVFTVSLSAVSGSTVTVDFTTANGSAVAPSDYLSVSGTLTFAPGEVSKQITVQTVGDVVVEANETFSVNLSNPTNATIAGAGYGLGTITNND